MFRLNINTANAFETFAVKSFVSVAKSGENVLLIIVSANNFDSPGAAIVSEARYRKQKKSKSLFIKLTGKSISII